ncbi:mechanosensitive ion channel family protein [Salarchaeum japonicum]|uniref:Mechanosensitive ion channel MscS domain-containing protein n=1 Tax=Salarchaeum japonicum TaxID=555573 RepID=A0AAV3T285_9EURY|nr:mechanosensitive ion channel family protein [Salarchaeum japonicum]
MNRRALALLLAALTYSALAALVPPAIDPSAEFAGVLVASALRNVLLAVAALAALAAAYALVLDTLLSHTSDRRRQHRLRSIVRLAFLAVGTVLVLAVVTDQWLPALVSLGVVGVAVSLSLQQPLLSLLGWVYITTKQPYQVGDRVAIGDSKGDIVDVDYLVTTLWEINGDLVSTNQHSGRHVTVPNSVVLSAHVTNYSRDEFPYVWNELSIQVAYETDLDFARGRLQEVVDDYLGDEMARNVAHYREMLAETPVEMEVNDRPTVNVAQKESWVELRARYLVKPRAGTRVRNDLYARVLDEFGDHPERIAFPVGRNR